MVTSNVVVVSDEVELWNAQANCIEAYMLDRFFGDGWFEERGIAIATKYSKDAETLARLLNDAYGLKARVKLRTCRDGHRIYVIRVWSKYLHDRYLQLLRESKKKSLYALPPVELRGIASSAF